MLSLKFNWTFFRNRRSTAVELLYAMLSLSLSIYLSREGFKKSLFVMYKCNYMNHKSPALRVLYNAGPFFWKTRRCTKTLLNKRILVTHFKLYSFNSTKTSIVYRLVTPRLRYIINSQPGDRIRDEKSPWQRIYLPIPCSVIYHAHTTRSITNDIIF